jgi:hypothetical protein
MLLRYLSRTVMRGFLLFASLFLGSCSLLGQNLIGYGYDQIKLYMKDNQKEMNFAPVVNSKYRYLKYTDDSDSKTLLFFLNPDSVCVSVRLICDLGTRIEKVKEFNTIYEKNGQNKWISRRDGKTYDVEMKDEEWSCVITIESGK